MESKPLFSDEYLWERETVIPDFDVSKFAEGTEAATFAPPDGDPTVHVPREVVAALRAESIGPAVIIRKALAFALMVSLGVSASGCWHHHHRVRATSDVQLTAAASHRSPGNRMTMASIGPSPTQ